MYAEADGTAVLRDAWATYHTTIDQLRDRLESTEHFRLRPESRNKAYHILFEAQAMAYAFAIAPRMENPRIYKNVAWQSDIFTLGQNCQDFLYGVTFLDGRETYRLTGSIGDTQMFAMQVLSGVFGDPSAKCISNTNLEDLALSPDGTFEIVLSAKPQPGHWVRLVEDVDFQIVHIRRAFKDWYGDTGDLSIERISDIAPGHYDADEFDPAAMAHRIQRAEKIVCYLIEVFALGLYGVYIDYAGGALNQMGLIPGTTSSEMGSPASHYAMGSYRLAEDEALVVTLDRLPDGPYWSYQLGDVWSRSLDHAGHMTSINDLEASIDPDGAVRVVIAHRDPGFANWLDTCGHRDGVIVLRNYGASKGQTPDCRTVKFGELDSVIPAGAKCVTPQERRAIIDRRLKGQRRLLGE